MPFNTIKLYDITFTAVLSAPSLKTIAAVGTIQVITRPSILTWCQCVTLVNICVTYALKS